MLFWPFMIAYILLFAAVIAFELYGVLSARKGDTISEGWWYIDSHSPPWLKFLWRVFTGGFIIWLLFHLAGPWR